MKTVELTMVLEIQLMKSWDYKEPANTECNQLSLHFLTREAISRRAAREHKKLTVELFIQLNLPFI